MGNVSLRKTLEAYLGRLKGPEFSLAREAWIRANKALGEASWALEQARQHSGRDTAEVLNLSQRVALAEEDLVAAEEMLRAIGEEIEDTESALAALPSGKPIDREDHWPCPACG
ncbi:MAG: hypothetical protein R3310_15355 [Candidatus Competibacteraceae bacterium]|nr:hypothetical protein [Candidatus Competibacteraceae bacterium]